MLLEALFMDVHPIRLARRTLHPLNLRGDPSVPHTGLNPAEGVGCGGPRVASPRINKPAPHTVLLDLKNTV